MSPGVRRRTVLGSVLGGGLGVAATLPALGCAAAAPAETTPGPGTDAETGAGARRVLVAYFSRAGENYYHGDRIDLEVGNTQVVAEQIASVLGCDTYRIEAEDPYSADYDATVARNSQEQDDDARPAVAGTLPALDAYDTILVGSPIWNVRPPMIIDTFLEGVDLAGKTVHPFVTHAVSGLGRAEDTYAAAAGDATLGEALAVQGEDVRDDRAAVDAAVDTWLARIDLT